MVISPDATAVRSHSMAQSSRLLDYFKQAGLTHDVNHFIPSGTGIVVKPWTLWNGVTRVPYNWEDDIHCLYEHSNQRELEPGEIVSAIGKSGGVMVFDFNPINIFLNTESMDRYELARPLHNSPEELLKHRFNGRGTRNRLKELISWL